MRERSARDRPSLRKRRAEPASIPASQSVTVDRLATARRCPVERSTVPLPALNSSPLALSHKICPETSRDTERADDDSFERNPPAVHRLLLPRSTATRSCRRRRVVPLDDTTLLFSQRRHEPVQGRLPRHRHAALSSARPTRRSASAPAASTTTSTTSARTPITTPSSRCSATGPSAITSRRKRSPGRGNCSPRCGSSTRRACTSPSSRATTTACRATTRRPSFWRTVDRHRPDAHPLGQQEGQLLGDGRDRAVRPLHRDPHRPHARQDRRARSSTRASTDVIEIWNLVFIQFNRNADKIADAAAGAARRYRHGLRARRRRSSRARRATTTPTSSRRSSTRSAS